MTIDLNKQITIAADIKRGLADFNDPDVKAYFIEKYAEGATDIELAEFISTCQADEAVPGRDIYFMKFKKKDGGYYPATFVHSIHWMTRKAEETGNFVGFTEPEFLDDDGTWFNAFWPHDQSKKVPVACKIGVIKKDTERVGLSIVRWDERAKSTKYGLREQWRDQGIHMLTKCAKAQALRDSGFQGLQSKYLREEMEPAPDGEWQPGTDVNEIIADRARTRSGDLEDINDKHLDHDDIRIRRIRRDLGLLLLDLKIDNENHISHINTVLKALDYPTIDAIKDLTYGVALEVATALEAARDAQGGEL